MKKVQQKYWLYGFIVLIFICLIFISGCLQKDIQNYDDINVSEEAIPINEIVSEELKTEEEIPKEIPTSYYIENVPYYGELGFCYGSSAMMILKYKGFSEDQVQHYRLVVKTGQGGPLDMFNGFMGVGVLEEFKIGYSRIYNKRYADVYNEFLDSEQTILFDNKEQAFEKLKKLISSDIPVIIIVHRGNHYVVATGYDEQYIYTNDPGLDNEWTYKIDGEANLKQRRIQIENLFNEWVILGSETTIGKNIGFPGNYGMIWIEGTATYKVASEDESGCSLYDDNMDECLKHSECEWIPEENICEEI